jgi:hypothetical protein
MIYLAGWAAIYCLFLVQAGTRYRGPILIVGLLFYFSAVAFFRGDIGTDTGTYESIFRTITGTYYVWNGLEPGFVILGMALIAILQDIDLAVRAVALVIFSIMAVFVIRGDRNERFLCLAYVLPLSAYYYSMNTLREGIAACILLLAVQAIRKGTLKRVFWTGFPAILFHYSALFSVSYIVISQRPWLKFGSVLGMLALLVLSGTGYLLAEVWFSGKAAMYAPTDEKGGEYFLSSIFGITRVSIILVVLLFGKLPAAEKFRLIFLGELFLLIAGVLAQYSYAGIRLYGIVSLVCPLSILASYSRLGLNFERSLKAVFIASSLIGAFAAYWGFNATRAWLPYYTWLP